MGKSYKNRHAEWKVSISQDENINKLRLDLVIRLFFYKSSFQACLCPSSIWWACCTIYLLMEVHILLYFAMLNLILGFV